MNQAEISESSLNAFVAMCFDERLFHIYHKVVKPVLESEGFYCQRGDEITDIGAVIQQINNAISKADLVLCDLTFENPNVFYELGFAHASNKATVLISQDAANIPFDVRHMRIIPYEDSNIGLLDLRENLIKTIVALFPGGSRKNITENINSIPLNMEEISQQRIALFSNSVAEKRYAIKFLGDCQDAESFKTIARMIGIEENPDILRDCFTSVIKIDSENAYDILIEEGLRTQKNYLVREKVTIQQKS
jgi:hypothetical protein